MARKKKNDFWDDVDEELSTTSAGSQSAKVKEEDWSATKSLPLKLLMRFLLMIACFVVLGSAFIAYRYIGDRYASGSYSNDFYESGSFAGQYNNSVAQLMQLVGAIDVNPDFTQIGNEEMLATQVENYMGKDTNFAFLVQDGDHFELASSGEDAKDRIEASTHYALISNEGGEISVKSTLSGSLLNKALWENMLSTVGGDYIIYCAVDNELTHNDNYLEAKNRFEETEKYFYYAKFTGVASAVIFLICLIFCIMATGMKRGYEDVCLTWYDRIFTEIALAIMVVVAGAIVYGGYRLYKMPISNPYFQYAPIAVAVVLYFWIAQSYFSIVRRIKAGRLLRYSLIGCIIAGIAGGIGKLPKPLNIIIGAILLIAINGGAVYGILFLKDLYTIKGIPASYIAAAAVFVIEILSLIVSKTSNDYDVLKEAADEEDDEDSEEEEVSAPAEETPAVEIKPESEIEIAPLPAAPAPEADIPQDWETMDLGGAIMEAEKNHEMKIKGNTEPQLQKVMPEVNETLFLPEEEMEKAFKAAGLAAAQEEAVEIPAIVPAPEPEPAPAVIPEIKAEPEDEGKVNFVQLNKDIRKRFKASLKKQGMAITVRAPEKPVVIDMDENSLGMIVSDIFSRIEALSKPDARTYAEIYLHGGKVVYIVKVNVREDAMDKAQAAANGTDFFETARKIVSGNEGKFIVSLEGEILKVGMLMEAAE